MSTVADEPPSIPNSLPSPSSRGYQQREPKHEPFRCNRYSRVRGRYGGNSTGNVPGWLTTSSRNSDYGVGSQEKGKGLHELDDVLLETVRMMNVKLPTLTGLELALEILDKNLGDVRRYMSTTREMIVTGPLIKENDQHGLSLLSTQLMSFISFAENLDRLQEIDNPTMINDVLLRLDDMMQSCWCTYWTEERKDKAQHIKDLLIFLAKEWDRVENKPLVMSQASSDSSAAKESRKARVQRREVALTPQVGRSMKPSEEGASERCCLCRGLSFSDCLCSIPVNAAVGGPSDGTVTTCALLNSSSTRTFCSKRVADRLHLKERRENNTISTLLTQDARVNGSIDFLSRGLFIRRAVPIKLSQPEGDLIWEPVAYRMTVHLSGGVWSPAYASFALQRTLEDGEEALKATQRSFYVDDLLLPCNSEEEATQLVKELCTDLRRGGFCLTKWMSNSRDVMAKMPPSERSSHVKTIDLAKDNLSTDRALGVIWDVQSDSLRVKEVHRKGHWDDKLEARNKELWNDWIGELQVLKGFHVDRYIVPRHLRPIKSAQLHHFCDASEKAYAVVTYLRLCGGKGNICCNLILACTRLAPLKTTTIPRLELCAAVLAVRSDVKLRKEISCSVDGSTYWTDSMIVLQYILNTARRFHTYVANRVGTIHTSSEPAQWQHLHSELNPADDATRGLLAQQLLDGGRWKAHLLELSIGSVAGCTSACNAPWHGFTDLHCGLSLGARLHLGPAFSEDIDMIEKEKPFKRCRLYRLEPILDEQGLLRVGGRQLGADDESPSSGPILLPNNHPGGVWERHIRSIRKVLSSIIGSQRIDDDRLKTLFCEVEATLNIRPLKAIPNTPSEPKALTPNHILRVDTGNGLPLGDLSLSDSYSRRWTHAQALADRFWKRWRMEYVQTLRAGQRQIKLMRILRPGDIVLVVEP
ncbi:hypothetical protein O3P69_009593 [Scylla paramamosain]|uniref:DUF5641 domain-containing protein n=1 Tax=Scylla paramamosain TaxID=85552 RepID=A0AAW0SW51_SCYPA